jgi:hypothetical protein
MLDHRTTLFREGGGPIDRRAAHGPDVSHAPSVTIASQTNLDRDRVDDLASGWERTALLGQDRGRCAGGSDSDELHMKDAACDGLGGLGREPFGHWL